MGRTIRWGILGAGTIADKFASALAEAADSRLIAIGSRSIEKARQFAARHRAPQALGSYEELVETPDVDVVYVATPHVFHRDHCLLALEANKAVLCEKPFATTADEVVEIISVARGKGIFCMEGMWMRCNPLIHEVRHLISRGAIGEVQMVRADIGYSRVVDTADRLFDPALGGGALLDLGVYPLSLAFLLLGEPESLSGEATIGSTGVDEQVSLVLTYPGQIASLSCSLRTQAPNDAHIMGTHGRIRVHSPMFNPSAVSLSRFNPAAGTNRKGPPLNSRMVERLRVPRRVRRYVSQLRQRHAERIVCRARRDGLVYEAEEVVRCLHQGLLQSELMPLEESLRVMEAIDSVRRGWQTTPSSPQGGLQT